MVLMDAFLPGVGDWKNVWLARDLWHFHFFGRTPEALVKGRERTYLDHFWNDFAADETKSISEADRQLYALAYARDDSIRATFQYFSSFEQDAKDFDAFAKTKLPMPMLVLTGEKASGTFLIDQARLVATNVRGVVVEGAGQWLMEEAPRVVIPELVAFITGARDSQSGAAARQRLTPADVQARTVLGAGAGTSGVSGIQTTVLKGDPTQPGIYTIQLTIPANTRIEAHAHPDDRVATVVSGTWRFGYGDRFETSDLKALSAGSFYTEPPSQPHFARTGDTSVVLQITGVGPTGTHYSRAK